MSDLIIGLYLTALGGLVFFGIHRVVTIWRYGRRQRRPEVDMRPPWYSPGTAPFVCVQCPIFNEPLVVTGLLESVAALDWYEDRMEIQLLDDSTDDTPQIIDHWLREHPGVASRFRHIRRADRKGFKAGALSHGMAQSEAPFFAIFDADFRPGADFLHRTLLPFADPEVGLVQARWEFRNRKAGFLTRMQSVFLDAHFVVEQTARAENGLFFNFNGTAGTWRRRALEEAGGWSADTVTEDLDVSYRAQLIGWRFVYLSDYPVPSELPEKVTAFKAQQQRWTKGGIQVMRKLLPRLLASDQPFRVKLEGFFHLTIGFVHFFLVLFALTFVPVLMLRDPIGHGLPWLIHPVVFLVAGGSAVLLYLAGQFFRKARWGDALLTLLGAPFLLSFGLAMSLTCCWAMLEGLFKGGGEFVRTPKGGRASDLGGALAAGGVRIPLRILAGMELFVAVLLIGGAVWFADRAHLMISVVLLIKASGYLVLVGWFIRESILSAEEIRGVAIAGILRSDYPNGIKTSDRMSK